MPTVKTVTEKLAERTHPETAAGWDPVGLQLGDPAQQVARLGVCHEVTDAVVEALLERPVELLITYHPLLFSPVNRMVSGRSPQARAFKLIQLNVSLVVIHTDFDAAPGGTADALAASYNLREIEPFGGDEEGTPAIGRIGLFGETLDALDARTADLFGSSGLRVSGDRDAIVEKVVVVPGSGSDFVEAAAGVADAIVTGDVSHHRVVKALDLGLSVVDPGHIATERPGMVSLMALAAGVPDVDVIDFTDLDPETWS